MTEPVRSIAITRVFEAPRERVWREWTEPERFADWFGGPESEVPLCDRPHGRAGRRRVAADDVRRPRRHEIRWWGEYREVAEPERLVFTLSDQPEVDEVHVVTVELADLGDGRTEMRFEQRGRMPQAQVDAAGSGWGHFFDRIARAAGGCSACGRSSALG